MKAKTKRRLELLDRVGEFFDEHPTLALGTRGTALVGLITTTAESIRTHGAEQVEGFGQFRGGVAERRQLAKELRAQILEIEMAAQAMDPETAPVPAEQLVGPSSRSFQALLDTAGAFVSVLTPVPVKAAFTDRDFPATFVTDLATLAADFAAATGQKYAGVQRRMEGTIGVDEMAARGVQLVEELKPIMSKKLRTTDPILFRVWKAASRAERDPQHTPEEAPAAPAAPTPPTPAG